MYKTNNLYLAAYLQTVPDLVLAQIEHDGRAIAFGFEPAEAAEQEELSYFAKRTSVDALEYADSIKALKGLISDQQKHGRGYRSN